jgi:hypothetical protein
MRFGAVELEPMMKRMSWIAGVVAGAYVCAMGCQVDLTSIRVSNTLGGAMLLDLWSGFAQVVAVLGDILRTQLGLGQF